MKVKVLVGWHGFVHSRCLHSHNDVVDGDMDELDKEPNKSHDQESNKGCQSNFLELCDPMSIRSVTDAVPFLSGLLHFTKNLYESFANLTSGCMVVSRASMVCRPCGVLRCSQKIGQRIESTLPIGNKNFLWENSEAEGTHKLDANNWQMKCRLRGG